MFHDHPQIPSSDMITPLQSELPNHLGYGHVATTVTTQSDGRRSHTRLLERIRVVPPSAQPIAVGPSIQNSICRGIAASRPIS